MFVDTHCHLPMMIKAPDDRLLNDDEITAIGHIIDQAQIYNVRHSITIATQAITSRQSLQLAERYSHVSATVGIHPCDIDVDWHAQIEAIDQLLETERSRLCSIGECGLDFYHPGYDTEQQYVVFRAQIERALRYDLPLVIHSRNAVDETLAVLSEYVSPALRGVIHCFSGTHEQAEKSIELGFFLGIGGPITYPKNDQLRDVVHTIGLEQILLETDAPFLPPQIIRGKQNHPRYIATIGETVANVCECPVETVAQITSDNAQKLFKLSR